VVVNARKAQVFVGQHTQFIQRIVNADRAGLHAFEQVF
jgi:hypothetical protein